MNKNTFREIFYKSAGYLAVLLISVGYITYSLINISQTGKTVGEIIASGVLSMIVGLLINGIFRSIGIQRGENDDRTIATETLHSKTVDDIAPHFDKLDSYCENETSKTVERIRRKMLARECLRYEDYFDENGVSLEFKADKNAKKSYKRKLKAYKKAVNLSIKPLTASNLTAEGASADDPYNFGKTKKQYTSGHNATDIVTRVIMAVVFGYFGVSLASEINLATIIWNSLQIVMYITGGIVQMYMSFSFVVNDYRHNKIRKIDILQKFKATMTPSGERAVALPNSQADRESLMSELWERTKEEG